MNCEKGKKIRPHPPGSQTEAHIQCSLWKRAVPPASDHLHLSSPFISLLLYIHLFFLPHISLTSTHPCSTFFFVFHSSGSLRISSLNLAGFHFELLPKKLSVRVHGIQVKKKKNWNWNSGPEAETGEDQSSPMNKITPEKSWTF